jgi:hypothetical protein
MISAILLSLKMVKEQGTRNKEQGTTLTFTLKQNLGISTTNYFFSIDIYQSEQKVEHVTSYLYVIYF